jgi:hypothetical protein
MALEDLANSILALPPPRGLKVSQLLYAVGGRDEFQEVRNAVAEASLWRKGMPASLVEFSVGNNIVSKICFIDSICWTAKMVEIINYHRPTIHAIQALILIELYRPTIPVSKIKGRREHKLRYYFTEWSEGLLDELLDYPRNISINIPEKVVTSLAEFVFNLTTCPIPKNKV